MTDLLHIIIVGASQALNFIHFPDRYVLLASYDKIQLPSILRI